jgi:hypothetical protein
MEEALMILPRRLRHLRLDHAPEMRTGSGIIGPSRLDLRFDAA